MTDPRRAGPLFAGIESWTEPSPLPDEPLITRIQESSARAVQAQPLIADTPMRPPPPAATASTRVVSTSNRHGAPSCATSSRVDFTLRAPRRALGVPFEPTRKDTVPSPWPLVPRGTIHDVSDVTVQVHSRAALTVRLPEPPPEGKALGDISTETAHLVALGAVAVTDVDVDDELQAVTTRVMRARTVACSRTR
jgi:hypothetical protein